MRVGEEYETLKGRGRDRIGERIEERRNERYVE